MFRFLFSAGWCVVLVIAQSTLAISPKTENDVEVAKSIPPLVGMAVASVPNQAASDTDEWFIRVTLPRVQWQVVGEMIPKRAWPQLQTSVAIETRKLVFGGPSQLRESEVVDIRGKTLGRAEVLERLKEETPVLVSVSGEMVDGYYLQLTKPEAVIIILGPRDGSPAPELLPAVKANSEQKTTNAKENNKASQ